MATRENWPQKYSAYKQFMDDIPLYFGDDQDASIKWDGSELDITAATVNIDGDVTLTGDLTIETDDLAVAQGYYIYLDGLSGGEYIRSDTAGDLMLNATTNLNLAIGGTDEVTISSTAVTIATNSLTLTSGLLTTDGGIDIGTTTTGIDFTGTVTDGIVFGGVVNDEVIQIGGTYDHGIRFTEDPQGGDNTNSFINVGDYGTAIAVAPTSANMFGVMHNVTMMDVNVAYWYQAYYTKITTSGTTTDTSVAGHAYRIMIGSSLSAVYGIQCHTYLTETISIPQEVISVSAYLEITTNKTITSGRVAAFQAMLYSEGTPATVTGDCVVAHIANAGTINTTDVILRIVNQTGATATDALQMDLGGTVSYAFKFVGSVCDAWASGSGTLNGSNEYVLIPVRVEGVAQDLLIKAQRSWG